MANYIPKGSALDKFYRLTNMPEEELLARTLMGEAGQEGYEGQLAAASVIRNRVADPRWPGSIREVILQPGQFSLFNDVTGYAGGEGANDVWQGEIPDSALAAARASMRGEAPDPTGGATHYYNPRIANPSWAEGKDFMDIGNHRFLSADGGGRTDLKAMETQNANRIFASERSTAADLFLNNVNAVSEELSFSQAMKARTLMPHESMLADQLMKQAQDEELAAEEIIELPIPREDYLVGGGGDRMLGGGEGGDQLYPDAANPVLSFGDMGQAVDAAAESFRPVQAPAPQGNLPTEVADVGTKGQQQGGGNWFDRNRQMLYMLGQGISSLSDPTPFDPAIAMQNWYAMQEAANPDPLKDMMGTAQERAARQLMMQGMPYEQAMQQAMTLTTPPRAERGSTATTYTPDQQQGIIRAAELANDPVAVALAQAGNYDAAIKRIDEPNTKKFDAPFLEGEREAAITTFRNNVPPEVANLYTDEQLAAMQPETLRTLTADAAGGNLENNQEYQRVKEIDLQEGQSMADGMAGDPNRQLAYLQGKAAGEAFDQGRERSQKLETDAATATAVNDMVKAVDPTYPITITPALARNPDFVDATLKHVDTKQQEQFERQEAARKRGATEVLREELANSGDPILQEMAQFSYTDPDDLSRRVMDHIKDGGDVPSSVKEALWLADPATDPEAKKEFLKTQAIAANGKLNKAEEKAIDIFAEGITKSAEASRSFERMRPKIGAISAVMQDDLASGPVQAVLLPIKKGLNEVFGIEIDDTSRQALVQSMVESMFSDLRVEGTGALSNLEGDRVIRGLPNLDNDPNANLVLLQVAQATAKYAGEYSEFAQRYLAENAGSGDLTKLNEGALMDAWEAYAEEQNIPSQDNFIPKFDDDVSAEEAYATMERHIESGYMDRNNAVMVVGGQIIPYKGRPQ